jgi:APA family basic amino acid/polyamine antiporter
VRWERRRLGPWSAAALIIGNMIGAGVFTTSGFSLADLGDPRWVLLAWLVGGVIALCGALAYGGLATRIPRSGGEYAFLSEALHPAVGFMAGWVSLLAGFTAPIALTAHVLEAYAPAAAAGWLGSGTILAFGVLHGVRVGGGVGVQNLAVLVKLAAILAFIGWAATTATGGAPLPPGAVAPSLGAFGVSLVWISFAYSGWNGAVYLAGEIREPARNIPRALWMTTLGVTLLYLMLNAVFLFAAPLQAIVGQPDIAAIAAQHLGGPTFKRAVSLLVALALATSISAMMMAGPRVYAQMARDGLFPTWLVRGGDAPTAAVALQTGLALLVFWVSDLVALLGYLGFTLSLSAALTVFAAARLRWREGAVRVPIPGYPWTPAAFVLFTVAAAGFLVAREPVQSLVGGATALLGLAVYFVRRSAADS